MRSVRLLLALEVAAVVSILAVSILAVGLPLGGRQGLPPHGLVALTLGAALLAGGLGTLLLWRAVARPLERMLAAARPLGRAGGLPVVGEDGDAGLALASVAFARLVGELEEERRQLAAKVEALTRADRALRDALDHLARSERLATTGRLAAGLAHEIGNPLGAICGYVEIARARLAPDAHPDVRDAVTRIADASARIDRILRELLDFARPTPAHVEDVEVGAVIEAALRLATVQPRFRAVEPAVALAPDLAPVRADRHRLAQVLLNLLLNAADAMGGVGRVEITARNDAGGVVELAVTDGGPGLAPEVLPRLFEPFFTTKAPGAGTGLGLATSHRIIEELGGTLSAENPASGGARFRIRLAAGGRAPGGAGGPC